MAEKIPPEAASQVGIRLKTEQNFVWIPLQQRTPKVEYHVADHTPDPRLRLSVE